MILFAPLSPNELLPAEAATATAFSSLGSLSVDTAEPSSPPRIHRATG